ncbi:MAG: glycosyl hydrolase [Planctomycetia bacterium]|nr:glycosyl hydrolase [Planctomycetia bacterium]
MSSRLFIILTVTLICITLQNNVLRAGESAGNGSSTESATFHFEPSPDYIPTGSHLNVVETLTANELLNSFASPSIDYTTGPLWVWNDYLTDDQIRDTLQDLKAQHIDMAFVHPRPGLATPYLSEQWFHLWSVALDQARKLNMKIWIYDENSYPSGFAGGFVPDARPELRGVGLDLVRYDELLNERKEWQIGDTVLYVQELLPSGETVDRTDEVLQSRKSGGEVPAKSHPQSKWLVSRLQYASASQWFGGKTYVNLMERGTIDEFIKFTHEAYRRNFGEEFGKLIPGAFTDEPQVASAGMFSWNQNFPEEFQARRGYDLIPRLIELIEPVGNWRQTRYDYYKTVLEVFIDRWHKPLSEYCELNNLQYTGHDWEHEWPNAHHCPDNMATAFWRQRPAIDLLMNNFSRGSHSQFGNVRSVRELSSVAHQSGRARTLSENYGAGGYDIRFADLKRLGDWSFALGVNTSNEHLSYISIRGARKHDHPQTFSYHAPWFTQYSYLEDYWSRLSYILSRGELTPERFLIIEPNSTVWMYQQASDKPGNIKEEIGASFASFLNQLEASQVDYDLGSEDIICRIGSVDGDNFVVGHAKYSTVVLPPQLECLDSYTTELLAQFTKNGGKLYSVDARWNLVNGIDVAKEKETYPQLYQALQVASDSINAVTLEELIATMRERQPIQLVPTDNAENLFHQTRRIKDGWTLFVCNIDEHKPATVKLQLNLDSTQYYVKSLNLIQGTSSAYTKSEVTIPPCSSETLVISTLPFSEGVTSKDTMNQGQASQADVVIDASELLVNGALTNAQPLDDNVLVIDYMTVKMKDETIENEYFYRANNWFWNKKGYPKSPWDNGVQFKDELITKKFDDESGFEVIYTFENTAERLDKVNLVIESPDLYKVYCNNKPINRNANAWKFDRGFGVYDIADAVKTGANEIKLVAERATLFCELMPIWIVGDFSLCESTKSFALAPPCDLTELLNDREKLSDRMLTASSGLEGVSWLSSGVDYTQKDDRAPYIQFKFAEPTRVVGMRVWNYCESNFTTRGIKDIDLLLLDENGQPVQSEEYQPISLTLDKGTGLSQLIRFPQPIQIKANYTIRFKIKSNWNGISYPLNESFVGSTKREIDSAFVGLAEIQFLQEIGDDATHTLSEQPQVSASSELTERSFNRRAQFVVDGSGLFERRNGWANQGMPFYANAVDYSFTINPNDYPEDRAVKFAASSWYGAVLTVRVQDQQLGVIGWDDVTVDLTSTLAEARQSKVDALTLTARVYGTPKNLFGPHHAGQLRGSAWPAQFHQAPAIQPNGRAYDVIDYGIFPPDASKAP